VRSADGRYLQRPPACVHCAARWKTNATRWEAVNSAIRQDRCLHNKLCVQKCSPEIKVFFTHDSCCYCACSVLSSPTARVRQLSMSINGRRHFRSHQSTAPACTHCAPLSQTVRTAVSNSRMHCSHWSHCAHFLVWPHGDSNYSGHHRWITSASPHIESSYNTTETPVFTEKTMPWRINTNAMSL